MATLSQLSFSISGRGHASVHGKPTNEPALEVAADGADLVRSLRDAPHASSDGGLRIVIDPDHRSLSMSMADRHPDDVLVTGHGAQVFLSATADERLRGCTLRAGAVGSGSWFYLDRSVSARSLVSQ
jgi:hypothetical protein